MIGASWSWATASRCREHSAQVRDRKSTRLNSSHTVIYTLSLHDALPISFAHDDHVYAAKVVNDRGKLVLGDSIAVPGAFGASQRSEEHTSELQSHSDLHSFPTRRSSDLIRA